MDTPLLTEIKNSINPNNEDDSLNPLIDQCYSFLQSNINEYPSNEHKTYLNEVLRFYTFEKKDVSSSFTRWQKWAAYRSKYHPESITEKDIPIQIKTGKVFIHGHDKEGRPCVVIKQSLHIPGETDMEEMIRYGFYIMEKALNEAAKVNKKDIVLLMDNRPTIIKFLLNSKNKYYSIDDKHYNTETRKYESISNVLDINTFKEDGFDIKELLQDRTINDETFKPISKFNRFKLDKYKYEEE